MTYLLDLWDLVLKLPIIRSHSDEDSSKNALLVFRTVVNVMHRPEFKMERLELSKGLSALMENQEELKMLKIYQNLGKSTFFRLNSTEHIPSPSSRPVLCSCYSKLIFVLPPLRDNFLRHLEDKIKSGHFSPRHLTRNQKRRTKCVKDSLARLKMEQIHEYPRENESFRQENSSLFGWKNLAENEEFKQNRDWPDLITNNFEVFICFVKCFSEQIMSVAVGDVKWGAIPGYFEVLELLVAILQQVFEWHLRQNVMADMVEKRNQDHRAGLPFKVTHKVNSAVMECSYTVVKGNPAVLDVFLRVAIENLDTQCARKVDRVLDQIRQWFFMSLQHRYTYGTDGPKAMHFHSNFDHAYFFGAVQALLESAHITILKRTLHFLYDFCPAFTGESRIDLFQSVLLSPRRFFPRLFLHWNSEVRDAFFFILVYKIIPLPPQFAAPGESGREKNFRGLQRKDAVISTETSVQCLGRGDSKC